MLFKNIFLFGILIILLLASCSNNVTPQSFFVPHEANTLKLKYKKDLIVSGGSLISNSYSNSNIFVGGESIFLKKQRAGFQAAYSPIKHLGVFGFHSRLRISDPNNKSTLYHKSHLTGAGIGGYYFFKFHQRPPHKVLPGRKIKYTRILFDVYTGYSFGQLENQYYFPPADNQMDFQKFYVQGGIHWEGSHWRLSYVHKVGKTNFLNGFINGRVAPANDPALLAILNKNNLIFQESTVRTEVMTKGIGLYAQLSTATIIDFNFESISNPFVHSGIVINIHEAKKLLKKDKP